MQPQQYEGDAATHYQKARQYADQAYTAYQSRNPDAFDMLIGLAEMQARLGHLSLAVSRRQDYVRHGNRRGNGGNQNNAASKSTSGSSSSLGVGGMSFSKQDLADAEAEFYRMMRQDARMLEDDPTNDTT